MQGFKDLVLSSDRRMHVRKRLEPCAVVILIRYSCGAAWRADALSCQRLMLDHGIRARIHKALLRREFEQQRGLQYNVFMLWKVLDNHVVCGDWVLTVVTLVLEDLTSPPHPKL